MINLLTSRLRNALAARHEPETQLHIAQGYWLSLVILFLGLVITSVAYGIWEFSRPYGAEVKSESVITARPEAPFDRSDLQEALQSFDTRALLFEERQDAPAVPDPS